MYKVIGGVDWVQRGFFFENGLYQGYFFKHWAKFGVIPGGVVVSMYITVSNRGTNKIYSGRASNYPVLLVWH